HQGCRGDAVGSPGRVGPRGRLTQDPRSPGPVGRRDSQHARQRPVRARDRVVGRAYRLDVLAVPAGPRAGGQLGTLDEGVGHAREVGFQTIGAKGVEAAQALPAEVVYIGISLGLGPAQQLAQTRPGARGAVLLAGALPVSEFSPTWPEGLPVQVHAMEHDPEFDNEWDKPAAEALVAEAKGELFLCPGDQHLFMDSSLPAYDAGA
ncbi:hypothetical protein BJM39_01640, partial [Salmonella enterica subsp. enterica serovar Javiana]